MVFLADFDGDPAEYLATFGLTIPRGLRWSFGICEDFPGGRPTRCLIDYVHAGRMPALLEYSAYPDAAVRDVDVALTVADRIERLRQCAEDGDDHTFASAYDQLLDALAPRPPRATTLASVWRYLRRRPTVGDLTVVMPLDPAHLQAPMPLPPQTAFATVAGTHYARVVQFSYGGRLYVLFSATFDGRMDDYLERLVAGLGPHADAIWRRCVGYPGLDDPAALGAWIVEHRFRPAMLLAAHPTTSVERIREVLALREQAIDLVAATQGLPLDELRDDLSKLWQT